MKKLTEERQKQEENPETKIILSRKGFDSKNGGIASPIMPDGTLLSLPIPGRDDAAKIKYEELEWREERYAQIISDLRRNPEFEKCCHLDPDIRKGLIQRHKEWRPAFGQSGNALSRLDKRKVEEGDLFLFFGWFRNVEKVNGKYQYIKGAPDRHIIFGYLQTGKILRENLTKEKHPELGLHPHLFMTDSKNNAIYVATEALSWDASKPGGGCLKLPNKTNTEANLVLTKEGFSRSRWDLPKFLKKVNISCHFEKDWNLEKDYFQSVPIGQEFVITRSENTTQEDWAKVERWAKSLIRVGSVE